MVHKIYNDIGYSFTFLLLILSLFLIFNLLNSIFLFFIFYRTIELLQQMSPTQQRGPYFGALKIGDPNDPDTQVPTPCMSAWQLTTSSDDPKHARVREILHQSTPQGTWEATKKNNLILSEIFQQKNVNDITGSNLFPIIGMNVFARIFGGTKNNKWEKPLAALLEEYSSIGALCAVGVSTSGWKRVGEVVHLVGQRIDETQVGKQIRTLAEEGTPKINGDKFINMLAFGFLFAGQGGTSNLASSTLTKIRSDPVKYTAMWLDNPRNFLIEQSRVDPPVTSYTSLVPEDTVTKIMGKEMKIKKGTTRQMVSCSKI